LCRHHHRLFHEGQWHLQPIDDAGGFTFVDTRGRELPARPPRQCGGVRAIRHPSVDADTIRSDWGGERLDLHMTIGNLRWHHEHPVPGNHAMLS
jgi:hypothetical protein